MSVQISGEQAKVTVSGDTVTVEIGAIQGPAGAAGAAGSPGPNSISDATTVGTLTAIDNAASVLATNAAGNAVRRIATPTTDGRYSLIVTVTAGSPVFAWVADPPSLDFSLPSNSMYTSLLL
jgi:hypothetical protein